jgi:hypothetical protein
MATRIDINETFDGQGNLLFSEQVEVEIPDETPITEIVASLTDEQRSALLVALQG